MIGHPISMVFHHNDKVHLMVIHPEDSDWWASVDGFDVHYCEEYNSVCVYESDSNYILIHKQEIKENEEQTISK
jgi:hypothetical protein